MKIFFINYDHDYTTAWERTKRDHTGDYYLWYLPLLALAKKGGHEVRPFWIDDEIVEKGRPGMNQALLAAVLEEKPDVCLFYGGEYDYDKRILAEIKEKSSAVTVCTCVDDSWSFDSLSKHFAPYFTYTMTWCASAFPKYKKLGLQNIIHSQVGVNLDLCKPLPGAKDIDVSFVGTWSKPRGKIIDGLKARGVEVFVRGNGWPEGGVSQDEMVRIFSHSKISLSLNPPAFYVGFKPLVRLFFKRARLGEEGPAVKLDIVNFPANFRAWMQKRIPQIKARHFEIPAFGTMEITQLADNLEDYYVPGEEIVIYKDIDDLVEKIHYYLDHPDEREAIAKRGYERTIRDHASDKRLEELFARVGHPLISQAKRT